jgi:hypothetical protein
VSGEGEGNVERVGVTPRVRDKQRGRGQAPPLLCTGVAGWSVV